jgi:hypothetical protein
VARGQARLDGANCLTSKHAAFIEGSTLRLKSGIQAIRPGLIAEKGVLAGLAGATRACGRDTRPRPDGRGGGGVYSCFSC